jgi:hypothetical protein
MLGESVAHNLLYYRLFALHTTFSCQCAGRGRKGSYPPFPRTDPGVRISRTGLFRNTRFRMAFIQRGLPLSSEYCAWVVWLCVAFRF